MGDACKVSSNRTTSAGTFASLGVSGRGNLLRPSAFAIFSPGLYEIEYWYALRVRAHRHSLADAMAGIALFSFNKYCRGL